jgi:hypothetical protein
MSLKRYVAAPTSMLLTGCWRPISALLLHVTKDLDRPQSVSISVKAESVRPTVTLAVCNVTCVDYWWKMMQENMQLSGQILVTGIAKLPLPSG